MIGIGTAGGPGRSRGFTLMELMIAVAILGILVSGAVPLLELTQRRAKEQDLRVALRQIRTAIDAYKRATEDGRIEKKADSSGYPPDLRVLDEGVRDAKSAKSATIYLMRRLPRDPFHADATTAAWRTWGRRSYASPPDRPAEGNDVFDVYSMNEGTGLNGVPYRQW